MKDMLTADQARELLTYDPETGSFFWRVRRGHRFAPGDLAGTVLANGYVHIGVRRRYYKAHRLAWLMMTGNWPADLIDHVNCVRTDNRWSNLREATRSQNAANARLAHHNSTGFKGVSFHKKHQRWQANIRADGKYRYLGLFDSPEAAHAAYSRAANQHFGEFARLS